MRGQFVIPVAGLFLLFAGCPGPEDTSTPDYERHRANPIALGQTVPDSVDYPAGDRTDWMRLELQDTGFLTVELILDNPDANVTVSLFDRYGKQIPGGRSTHRKGEHPLLKMMTDVGIGRYFIRVQADTRADKTGYAIKASLR